jgi:pantetheine-phosphate adenylyltransferase
MSEQGDCSDDPGCLLVKIPLVEDADGGLIADFNGVIDVPTTVSVTVYVAPTGPYLGLSPLRFATGAYSAIAVANHPRTDLVVVHPACSSAARAASVCPLATRQPKTFAGPSGPLAVQADNIASVNVGAAGYRSADSAGGDIFERYDVVVVGGTFDRLHAGHRLLLTAAAWASNRKLWIGVTSAKLLIHKAHADLIAPFEDRAEGARQFARRVRPDLAEIEVAELHDPAGPSGYDPTVNAMVVSCETMSSAHLINAARLGAGLDPMEIVVVDVLNEGKTKLSSTILREEEALRGMQS